MNQQPFQFASDTTKQVLTLSTALLTVSVTFADKFYVAREAQVPWSLGVSWIVLTVSIVCGAWTLMALTGTVAKGGYRANIYGPNVRLPSGFQVIAFLAGIVLTVHSGFGALYPVANCP